MVAVALAGTLDTKGDEYAFLAAGLRQRGVDVVIIDVGTRSAPTSVADVSRFEVAARAGLDLVEVQSSRNDRAEILSRMGDGLRDILLEQVHQGRIAGVAGMGGSGAVTLLAPAFSALPVALPKFLLTTMPATTVEAAAGSDLTIVTTLLDIGGLNSFTAGMLERLAAMVAASTNIEVPTPTTAARIALTMFGVTTTAATAARDVLQEEGYEVLTFHANGAGGRCMERMIRDGVFQGVLDLTTTELTDQLLGGKAAAGPDRLTAAAFAGVPQVVAPGALDIANFGAPHTLPEPLAGRTTYQHGPLDTLVKPSAAELCALARQIVERTTAPEAKTRILLPTGGLSALSEAGGAFHDADGEDQLCALIAEHSQRSAAWERVAHPLNSVEFGRIAARTLIDHMNTRTTHNKGNRWTEAAR